MTIRVVFGEDSYLARAGILRALEGEQDIEIVAICGDFDSLRSAVGDERPDVVLTDIRMPPTATDEGIRLAAELVGAHRAAPRRARFVDWRPRVFLGVRGRCPGRRSGNSLTQRSYRT